MNGVRELQEREFAREVTGAEVPVLVDFFAPWCGPCRALAPVLEDAARDYAGRLKVVKVNVDEARQLAADFQIRGVPTLVFFRDGKPVDSIVGLPSVRGLRAKLDGLVRQVGGGASRAA